MKRVRIEISIPEMGRYSGRDIFIPKCNFNNRIRFCSSFFYGIDLAKKGLDFEAPPIMRQLAEEGDVNWDIDYSRRDAFKAYQWAKKHIEKGRIIANGKAYHGRSVLRFAVALQKVHDGKSLHDCTYHLVR